MDDIKITIERICYTLLTSINLLMFVYVSSEYKTVVIYSDYLHIHLDFGCGYEGLIYVRKIFVCKNSPKIPNLEKSGADMKLLKSLIRKNSYIKKCKSNTKRDFNSLSYLITRKLSQSDCIKLGNGVEKIFYDIILSYTSLVDIKEKNRKGKREKDHLFCDHDNKVVYYSEFKSNINLDTEKSKATWKKCLFIRDELKQKYPGYNIEWCLVACRYTSREDIPKVIKHKYINIKENVLGINEYLHTLKVNLRFTDEDYKIFLNDMVDEMFE